ncbi:hypothetical protein PR048_013714 [Dryococelus australis]|uniref:Integrase catalytic domain-containing protein n=1 Tax=Dryococelus australis TaxID=614101 RepID=A0ABQ9HTS9_9NEOP|nr:hypothetical protein PR048_013714 [Dryococelus australis]
MFTKFVELYPIKQATVQVVTEKVMGCYVLEVGQPKKIISDNGPQFHMYHPAANPVEMFRTYCNEHHNKWAAIVSDVEHLIKSSWHEGTGATSLELMNMGNIGKGRIRISNQ